MTRSSRHPSAPFSEYTFTLVRFPICVFIFLVAFKHEHVYGISAECDQFCDDSRPIGNNNEYRAYCGVTGKESIEPNHCPGLCKANKCDDSMCPDGEFVTCPDATASNSRSWTPDQGPPARKPKPWSVTAIILIICAIVIIVIVLILACIYLYFVMIRKRRVRNHNQYQAQAPRTYADGRTPRNNKQTQHQNEHPPSADVATSSHYMTSEGGVLTIPPKNKSIPPTTEESHPPENYDYAVQPQ